MENYGNFSLAPLLQPDRLKCLRDSGLLDSPPEDAFDRLTRIATRILGVPVALVSLVDDHRQFFKSAQGLPEPWATKRETPLSHSFCKHIIAESKPLIVTNAHDDTRFRDNAAVRDLGVIAYLGIPMVTEDNHALGSFCAIDTEPREWSDDEIGVMKDICAIAMSKIELRLEVQREQKGKQLAEAAQLKAERADLEKSRFLANMSHEIRTPMNAIIGFSELLEGHVESPRAKHYLTGIKSSGESLLNLINDILDLSKIEAGKLELCIEPTDIREVAGSIRLLFSQQAQEKQLAFSVDVDENCPAYLEIDELRVRQVLLNLIGNSMKFTDVGAVSLFLECGREDEGEPPETVTLIASVRDTGRGISAHQQMEIFDPFRQAIEDDNDMIKGTGLGLSICQRLVDKMGGTIRVESSAGNGATFTVKIPSVRIAEPIKSTEDRKDRTFDMEALQPSTLLIVDDNDYNREVAGGFFEETHHTVHYAKDGLEAVRLTKELRPDAVLMDIRMPRMDGREALLQIKSDPAVADTPVLAITASSLLQEERELRNMFDGYMRKPFRGITLFDLLAAVIPSAQEAKTGEASGPSHATFNIAEDSSEETIDSLRDLELNVWPAVSDTMAIGEVIEFAKTLTKLGNRGGCGPLSEFGEQLRSDAEHFKISNMETRLTQFPELTERIEATLSNT